MEENFNNINDFEELRRFYFDLGVEFRKFVIKYNINHNVIKEKKINIFFKTKTIYLSSKKNPHEESIDHGTDKTPTINNEEEKEMIEGVRENKQDEQEEIIDDLKEQIQVNNKKTTRNN